MQSKKKKNLFWISATGPLVTVILLTLFSFVTKLNKHVATVNVTASPAYTSQTVVEEAYMQPGARRGCEALYKFVWS